MGALYPDRFQAAKRRRRKRPRRSMMKYYFRQPKALPEAYLGSRLPKFLDESFLLDLIEQRGIHELLRIPLRRVHFAQNVSEPFQIRARHRFDTLREEIIRCGDGLQVIDA